MNPQICSYFQIKLLLPNAPIQTYSPKLFLKIKIESCSKAAKTTPKIISEKNISQSSRFFKKIVRQCWKNKPRSYFPKLLFKVVTGSRVPKKFPKIIKFLPEITSKLVQKGVQRCSSKLCSKFFSIIIISKLRFYKFVRQSGSPKPLYKSAPESCKVTTKSCFTKFLFKLFIIKLQFVKSISQNNFPKLFYKVSPKN